MNELIDSKNVGEEQQHSTMTADITDEATHTSRNDQRLLTWLQKAEFCEHCNCIVSSSPEFTREIKGSTPSVHT